MSIVEMRNDLNGMQQTDLTKKMTAAIDLKLNYPSVEEEIEIAKNYFRKFLVKADQDIWSFPDYQGNAEMINLAAKWLNLSSAIFPGVADIIACNSGNQALLCVFQTLRRDNSIIITEPFTYPAFKSIALQNGYQLQPDAFDENGITLEGLEKAHGETGGRLLYLQPTIHNPTCVVMPLERRKQIAEFAVEKNILIVEDDAYRFLHPNPPASFLELIPENVFHIYSLSKPFNPLIKTAFVIAPKIYKDKITDCVRLSSSGNSSLLSDFAGYLFRTEILQKVIEAKRRLAERLQSVAISIFDELNFKTFPSGFHLWVELPKNIKSTELVNKLARQNIIVSGGTDFSVGASTDGECFIRVALGAERDLMNLEKGLRTIVSLVKE